MDRVWQGRELGGERKASPQLETAAGQVPSMRLGTLSAGAASILREIRLLGRLGPGQELGGAASGLRSLQRPQLFLQAEERRLKERCCEPCHNGVLMRALELWGGAWKGHRSSLQLELAPFAGKMLGHSKALGAQHSAAYEPLRDT